MSKIILVTGASTGLGVAFAVQAAAAGHTVYASMRNLDKRATLDAAVAAAGTSLNLLQLDVQDSASVDAAVATVMAEQGRIDVLVNNAGAGFARSTEQASEDEIAWVMDVNYFGVVRCTKAVLPHMRQARSGHIITISSVGGLVGQPFNELYCGAKFGVEGYIEALVSYVTPSFGINFTLVEPGGISSEFFNSALKAMQASGGILEDEYGPAMQAYLSGSAARRAGRARRRAGSAAPSRARSREPCA
ncbi:MAG: SDR family NAD(P)-dependent oxidoreductase, partial [Alphaproteobacteria bacterium]|nr:SDR family NAD(P)-dependent oxidoreductase [Alphaproteobacteria bacterium]